MTQTQLLACRQSNLTLAHSGTDPIFSHVTQNISDIEVSSSAASVASLVTQI